MYNYLDMYTIKSCNMSWKTRREVLSYHSYCSILWDKMTQWKLKTFIPKKI